MGLSTFLATFSQIHLVTLTVEAQLRWNIIEHDMATLSALFTHGSDNSSNWYEVSLKTSLLICIEFFGRFAAPLISCVGDVMSG
jgi:hypothetical protein